MKQEGGPLARSGADTQTGTRPLPPDIQAIFASGGEVGRLMPEVDWARSPVGPVQEWPQSLRTAVSICLSSRHPMVIWWGPDQAQIYNDAFSDILGAKHPSVGRPGREVWPEIWDIIGPMMDGVRNTGQATWSYDHYLPVNRKGFLEEAYFTYSYSPVRDESGAVSGVFTAVTETTARVLSERRLRTLRELADQAAEAKSAEEACRIAVNTLTGNPDDIPFALLYLFSDDLSRAELAGAAQVPEEALGPIELEPAAGGSPWPLHEVVAGGRSLVLTELPPGLLDSGPVDGAQPVRTAVALPVTHPGQGRVAGCLVVGVSPRLMLDEAYESFFELIAGQVAKSIADARAYEAERRRAEALTELDRAKTVFFSNVSHEFRTPLTLLLGPLEDALRDPNPSIPAILHRVQLAHRNALRMLKLVNTLLDFSRLEAGRIEAAYEAVDLGALTAELASLFRSAVERGGVELLVEVGTLSQPAYVDQEMWEKVILNLLSNAFKFTFEGQIRVSVGEESGRAVVTVEDTGIGIPGHELPRLFDRFHRVQGARGRTHEGTGIGLSLVHELVGLHGGTVTVQSELQRGTIFRVEIPLGSSHLPAERIHSRRHLTSTALDAAHYVGEAMRWLPGRPAEAEEELISDRIGMDRAPAADPGRTGGARILVADDNADMREYLGGLLGQHWQIELVGDGSSALDAATTNPPDLVLTDVMMPGLDGFELLARLRAHPSTSHVPVIMLSARAGQESTVEGLERGADDYLVKPFSARELVARVRSNLELARAREAWAQLEVARREADRMAALDQAKTRFLNLASHELRGPLAVIRGYISMIADGSLDDPERLRAAVPILTAKSAQMELLVNQLLDAARIDDERLALSLTRIDLCQLVRSTLAALRGLVPEGQEIDLRDPAEPIWVMADGQRMDTVVSNLLDNALKYSPAGGRIQVELTTAGDRAVVEVADRGLGIDAEDLPVLFTKFGRIVNAENSHIQGTGLGLFICRELVRQHGGDITVRSEPGQGSRFRIELPLA